jgi:thymidylate synthase (FAD)
MSNFYPEVFTTTKGTSYLKEPGVILLAQPAVALAEMQRFIDGFDSELGFGEYLTDDVLPPAEALVKAAGQLCYMSLGRGRTKNAEAKKYLDNIKSSGHGSVLEHANFTFLLYGIDRAATHELVRHRAGWAFSQVSQRYVDGKVLRFVERPEFQTDEHLHAWFLERIDVAAYDYDVVAQQLLRANEERLASMQKRDARKAVNQAARALLPNETEAPIVVTANVRAWRHFLEMRAAESADRTICEAAFRVGTVLKEIAPILFDDFTANQKDGRNYFTNTYRKV